MKDKLKEFIKRHRDFLTKESELAGQDFAYRAVESLLDELDAITDESEETKSTKKRYFAVFHATIIRNGYGYGSSVVIMENGKYLNRKEYADFNLKNGREIQITNVIELSKTDAMEFVRD